MKHLRKFNESFDVDSLLVGNRYKITPDFVDEDEVPESDMVEVIRKGKDHYLFKAFYTIIIIPKRFLYLNPIL